MTINVLMLKSPTCHACQATMPLMEQVIIPRYNDLIHFWNKDVVKTDPIMRFPDDREEQLADFLHDNCAIPIDIDENLSEEEREEYRREGIKELASLPTFVIWDDEKPMEYELLAGGVGEDHDYKDDKQFIKDMCKLLNKYVSRTMRTRTEAWKYGRLQAI